MKVHTHVLGVRYSGGGLCLGHMSVTAGIGTQNDATAPGSTLAGTNIARGLDATSALGTQAL